MADLWRDPEAGVAARVADLIGCMTLEEKCGQMLNESPAIERLGIPQYDWWNECLHGVGRAGIATVFPQAIAMAASWNVELMERIATAISDEARAKHHDALRRGCHGRYFGLTYWTPNINLFRDPRWGRGHETYGEDPYLTGRLAVAFVRGLQGDDEQYLKLVATPKHFAVHSGPEADRHTFDATASPRDLEEYYLPHFRATVQEAGAESIMGAYNRTNGEPCCASPTLLQGHLRDKWGFTGYVVSDCGAIEDIYEKHKTYRLKETAIAAAVKAGCDLCCGYAYDALVAAVQGGHLDEADVDRALNRLLSARFRLGMFDPEERVPYAAIPLDVVRCAEHQDLALQSAREGIVLLKNEGVLPLEAKGKTIAVVGPTANVPDVALGNYNGTPLEVVTPLAGIARRAFPATNVTYLPGCELDGPAAPASWELNDALKAADIFIAVVGLAPHMEAEEGAGNPDRVTLDIPASQQAMLEIIKASGKPLIVVLTGGSALGVKWVKENADAALMLWYAGEAGGTALAEVLFGDCSPAGRLPVTFYESLDDLPPYDDYDMSAGRTYRSFRGAPLWAFGHGLSYTRFSYRNLKLSAEEVRAGEGLTITVDVHNAGARPGDEVAQLYVEDVAASVPVPIRRLEGFVRVSLDVNETARLSFALKPEQITVTADDGTPFHEPGRFRVWVGGGQPGHVAEYAIAGGEFTLRV